MVYAIIFKIMNLYIFSRNENLKIFFLSLTELACVELLDLKKLLLFINYRLFLFPCSLLAFPLFFCLIKSVASHYLAVKKIQSKNSSLCSIITIARYLIFPRFYPIFLLLFISKKDLCQLTCKKPWQHTSGLFLVTTEVI